MTEKNNPAIEIVPYDREQEHALDLKRAMTQLIEEKVAEITGGPTAVFEPFFQSKRLATEIRRQQSVPEQNKHVYYFERWGCSGGCGATKETSAHGALGFCSRCHRTRSERYRAILREHAPHATQDESFIESVNVARAALDPSMRMLALTKEQKPRYYTQREAAAAAGIDSKTLYLWVRNGDVQPSIQITPKKSMWSEADVEELKLLKSKNASHHGSAASRARWSKPKEITT